MFYGYKFSDRTSKHDARLIEDHMDFYLPYPISISICSGLSFLAPQTNRKVVDPQCVRPSTSTCNRSNFNIVIIAISDTADS